MRHPNTECTICKQAVYRRPSDLSKIRNVYCSKNCQRQGQEKLITGTCNQCKNSFSVPEWINRRSPRKFCSHACSNRFRRGIHYTGQSSKIRTRSSERLTVLKNTFNFGKCMVEGCGYSKVYDIHRLVHGKQGGSYEIGNMFAICPNHHAEVHRGVITLTKVNNHTLRIVEGENYWKD